MMNIFHEVTEAQKDAIRHRDGPLLVLAGAGSGKTRVVTRRIAALVRSGVAPHGVLGITFTNKASDEMRERVRALVEEDIWISTFHSFCARILRRHILLEGYTNDFTIYDEDDRRSLIKEVLIDQYVDLKQNKPAKVAAVISKLKNSMVSPEDASAELGGGFGQQLHARAYESYQQRLRRNNALDFDDLLLVCIDQIESREDLRENLRNRFLYILVDEYQDTNRAQYRLINLLAEGHRNLCVTGDPDQSIYRWRGADIRNILDFEKDYPDAKVVKLEQNWRSTKAILALADALIEKNATRKHKGIWTENPSGHPPTLVEAADEEDEAMQVAGEIADLVRGAYVPSDIAIFYRTNAQSRSLESGLRYRGVPYVIVGAVEFYRRKEVKDILAYLRLAANFRDDVSFLRAVNTPPRGIGLKSVDAIRQSASGAGLSLFEGAKRLEEAGNTRLASKLSPFLALVGEIRDLAGHSLREAVECAVEKSGYGLHLEETGDAKDRERLENLGELGGAAAEFEAKSGPRAGLRGFLEEVALVSEVDGLDRAAEAVSLMTLHASKGLEFPVVFITGLEEDVLPHARSRSSEDEIEEERRLCFVGITRAMDRLTFSFARRRTSFGDRNFQRPSRFLEEAGLKVKAAPSPAPSTAHRDWGGDWRYEPDMDYVDGGASYGVGDRVYHPKYGEGDVVSFTGIGKSMKVMVRFSVYGQKLFKADTAPLVKIGM
ncbi:MAG: ATP-dependent helicase [Planctomycetota bacterium]|jgi:DNA helicase-2/ATP-dependent DNA helicase PcrA